MIACDVKIQPEKKKMCVVKFLLTYKEVHELKSYWCGWFVLICVKQANTVFFVKHKHCFNLGQI